MPNNRYNAIVMDDTYANWQSDNTIYAPNILMFATDTGTHKRGNGVNYYRDLPFIVDEGGSGDIAAAQLVGTVYDKSNWSNLADFSTNTANATIVGGQISIPNAGVVDFSKSLQLAPLTCVNNWLMEIEFKLTVPIASGTTGISIGLDSANTDSRNSWANYFRMSSDDNTGRMQFFGESNNGDWTTHGNAASNLTFAQNNTIRLSIERVHQRVYLRAQNLSNPVEPVVFTMSMPPITDPIPPNTGRFSIYGQGGACIISKIRIINKCVLRPEILLLGDSKTQGFGATDFKLTYGAQVGSRYENVVISAGFGDKTSDLLARIQEVLLINPKCCILSIGSNDKRFGVSNATFQANYLSITNQLNAAGISVIHLSPSYETAQDLTEQYNFVKTLSPFIDVFYTTKEAGNLYEEDGIHWSDKGNDWVSQEVLNSNLLAGLTTRQQFI